MKIHMRPNTLDICSEDMIMSIQISLFGTLTLQTHFDALSADDFCKHVTKGEIAHDEQFLLGHNAFNFTNIKLYFMQI